MGGGMFNFTTSTFIEFLFEFRDLDPKYRKLVTAHYVSVSSIGSKLNTTGDVNRQMMARYPLNLAHSLINVLVRRSIAFTTSLSEPASIKVPDTAMAQLAHVDRTSPGGRLGASNPKPAISPSEATISDALFVATSGGFRSIFTEVIAQICRRFRKKT